MGADDGVMACGGQCGHGQGAADLEAAAVDAASAPHRSGVPSHGRHADQSGDLPPGEVTELRQVGDQGGAGDWADAAGGAQQCVEFTEVGGHVSGHIVVDIPELFLDGLDQRFDATAASQADAGTWRGRGG